MGKLRCLGCDTILESTWVHDFQMCDCENKTFIDGGNEYLRFGAVDMSLIDFMDEEDEDEKISS